MAGCTLSLIITTAFQLTSDHFWARCRFPTVCCYSYTCKYWSSKCLLRYVVNLLKSWRWTWRKNIWWYATETYVLASTIEYGYYDKTPGVQSFWRLCSTSSYSNHQNDLTRCRKIHYEISSTEKLNIMQMHVCESAPLRYSIRKHCNSSSFHSLSHTFSSATIVQILLSAGSNHGCQSATYLSLKTFPILLF